MKKYMKMNKKTKQSIYNVLYWTGRVICLPLDVLLLLAGVMYSYVWEPLDYALLDWVSREDKPKD